MRQKILLSLIVLGFSVGSVPGNSFRHSLKTSQGASFGCGVVSGKVLDPNGQPVAGAKVYSLTLEHPPRGRLNSALTNREGTFKLTCAELGRNSIYVSKEAEGYPDTLLTPFLDRELIPVVNVSEQGAQGVEVRLPPKAARLNVQVIDAATRQPIEGATITLCRVGRSRDCHEMNANQTVKGLSQLLPPVPLSVKASAPDHEDWLYSGGPKNRPNMIQLAPNTTKSVVVLLKPRKRR